jgi:PilZ domain
MDQANSATVDKNDIVLVQGENERRGLIGMRGEYELASWRDARGQRRKFACRATSISAGIIEVTGSITGHTGEWVTVDFNKFGKYEGPIIRIAGTRLTMRVVTTIQEREKIADKIIWFEKNAPDKRRHERFVPDNPNSVMYLPDGHCVECRIIDYSVSGAGVATELIPEIGTLMIVGKIFGRVARHFSGGFGFEFQSHRTPHDVQDLFVKTADS